MKIRVSEATGVVLDWMVAQTMGGEIRINPGNGIFVNDGTGFDYFTPSSDWSQGGPIIERERMELLQLRNPDYVKARTLYGAWMDGPTPLIAAMRCYVASVMGDEVDVPDELLEELL